MEKGDAGKHHQVLRFVLSGAVENDDGMAPIVDGGANFVEMAVHFRGVCPPANVPDRELAFRPGGGEKVAESLAAGARDPRPGTLARPDKRVHVFLSGAARVLEP